LFKEIIGYSGWNLFGALSSIGKGQGINILLNMFFSPVVNAARAIAYQIDSVILNFGNNFFMAVRPRIIKLYASHEHREMMTIILKSTRFSFFLLLFLSLPLLLETNFLLDLWLKNIPDYSIMFIRLVIIDTLLELLINPLATLVQASGKIKWYQIIVGGTRILNLPVAYLVLRLGYSPVSVFYVLIINTVVCNILRLIIVKRVVACFDIKKYVEVILSVCTVSFFTFIIPKSIQIYYPLNSLAIILITLINSAVWILFLGMNGNERMFLYNFLIYKIKYYL
jgi:O-antigen/teichoic acid export membrane protein